MFLTSCVRPLGFAVEPLMKLPVCLKWGWATATPQDQSRQQWLFHFPVAYLFLFSFPCPCPSYPAHFMYSGCHLGPTLSLQQHFAHDQPLDKVYLGRSGWNSGSIISCLAKPDVIGKKRELLDWLQLKSVVNVAQVCTGSMAPKPRETSAWSDVVSI